jgi:hypothetical protein
MISLKINLQIFNLNNLEKSLDFYACFKCATTLSSLVGVSSERYTVELPSPEEKDELLELLVASHDSPVSSTDDA